MKILVILGHRLQDDGTMDATLKCRLDTALSYYKEEINPDEDIIIVSGGIANKKAGIAEATLMGDYLVEKGVPEKAIIREISSRTTKQNAKFSKGIIQRYGVTGITLCTSKYHFDRKLLNPVKLFQRELGKNFKIEKVIAPNIE